MVYFYLAPGFEEVEALTPADYLRRCGCEVRLIGVGGRLITGAHGITVQADCTAEEARELPELVVLPGGMPGTKNLMASKAVTEMVCNCARAGKYVAAICAAPSVLGRLGLLAGKRATCYPGFEDELAGAAFVREPVVVDGKLITSRGAGTANQFAFALAEALCGKEEAATLKAAVQWE